MRGATHRTRIRGEKSPHSPTETTTEKQTQRAFRFGIQVLSIKRSHMLLCSYRTTRLSIIRQHQRFLSHHSIAIVGAGAAGLYCAKYLIEKDDSVKIDLWEKLPVPFGLIRYGVAPDHQDATSKSLMQAFEEMIDENQSRVRFFGNAPIGSKLTLEDLQSSYSGVILSYGASSDVELNVPTCQELGGEGKPMILSAREFVNFYNGHPESSLHDDPKKFDLSQVKDVVIVGHGNVALDCARILTKNVDALVACDGISSVALSSLRDSAVRNVTVMGRRGHVQSSFTIKELRELTRLEDVSVNVFKSDLRRGWTESSAIEAKGNRPKDRILKLIDTIAMDDDTDFKPDEDGENNSPQSQRTINLRFLMSPKCLVPDGMMVKINELMGPPHQVFKG